MERQDYLYGMRPVREALRAGRSMSQIYLLADRRDRLVDEIINLARESGVPIRYESRRSLQDLSGSRNHQGVVALTSAQRQVDLQALLTKTSAGGAPVTPLIVVLDQVVDPHNLGAVVRTSEAAGASGVIIPSRNSSGLTSTVAKVSAGALSHLPVIRVGNLRQTLDRLKKAGIWLFGLEADGTDSYWDIDFTVPLAIIAGSEGKGLRPLIRQGCDRLLHIPMQGKVGSLNVSVSVGLVLYEILRQRGT